ncbi:MAG: GNAT family N-acetyltransferase, partial [Ktedonobacteraceae bacterium]|nr:GNAT family N-acetyltransferase [Ktedonobacteraceae bacterium]
MTASTLIVRTLATQEEREQYCWLTEEAFYPSPTPEGARRHLHFFQTLPNHQPEQWRGVFLGGKLVGGCFIGSRLLRMGRALLPTGCIGGVVTHPEYRKRGVAAALMQDAIRYSQTQRLALLMLDGIADFYHRYGYIDVFDSEVQEVQRAALLAHAPSAYTVRQATEGDAEPLLALYERQYNHYTGSFVRTLADQQHKLQHYGEDRLVILASDSTGAPRGYALLSRSKPERVAELAADDWEATLALAQYHARLFTNEGAPEALRYRIPPQGAVTQRLIDRLSLPVDPKGEKS